MFNISEVDKSDTDLMCLISELDAFQSELYPVESNHCLDFSTVADEQLRCVIVHDEAGSTEIKRVYIRPEHRGRRLGEKIVSELLQKRI